MKSIFYSRIIPVFAVLLLTAACGNDTEQDSATENDTNARERVVAVEVMSLERGSFNDRIRINGNVTAHDDAMIAVETPGQVQFIAERGTQVNRGDIIMRIDDRLLKANFDAAQSGFALAEDVYQRQAALFADSVISTVQYLQSKSQRDQARAQLAAIEKQLNDAELRAPFSGRIEERFTSVGQFASPGMPALRLVNTGKVKVTGGVPERFAGLIRQGTPVHIHFRNYDIPVQSASVRFAGNMVNPDSRTFPIEVILDNPTGSIKPLMVADMHVLRQQFENQIVIPRTAVIRNEEGNSVFVVQRENGVERAATRRIDISLASGDFVIIASGLDEGDELIVSGLTAVGEGDRLNITGTLPAIIAQ
ncbi:MAG: efflux RND transporter periplasmic adaptor subunit [Bacteroidetes bacterium]|nr:efflux RND transporter periplasmic adaptor subunit [Bacteroidota bacterium]MCH8523293.1 efflux RND transporter periplasmic adaptor subunit [Balneolales bacterium]